MMLVREVDFSMADVSSIEQQVRFLEGMAAENHWKKLAVRTCITIVVVCTVFAISRSPLWSLLVLIPLLSGRVPFSALSQHKICKPLGLRTINLA